MNLSKNIATIRKRWRMKQDEFADIFELNRGNISNYERAENKPDVIFLVLLQDLTGINAKALCYEKIKKEDIPELPLETPYEWVHKEAIAEEPNTNYEINKNLYNFHELVHKVELLSQRVTQLEGKHSTEEE